MSYLALYRKYRPFSFDDLVGQNEMVQIIKNEILNDKISHAYLFSGPRGTGKTSTAKIIARMINCANLGKDGVPCGKCQSCLDANSNDVVEIDAASNNGVDEIRELRDKVNLVPTYGRYKVYIIDEVHMLTTQAFNALLKTLEEPPAHAIFILATTEFYKIPATVVSRCQKFQFVKFSIEEIVNRLNIICKKEKIKVDDDVLYEIARISDGGLRDAINMLDQLSCFSSDKINIEDVYKLNGVVSFKEISDVLLYIINNDVLKIVNYVDNLNKIGINIDRFIVDLVCFLKDLYIYKSIPDYLFSNSIEIECFKLFDDNLNCENILYLIDFINDLVNKVKNSDFPYIILNTNFIYISNYLCKKSNVVDNGNIIDNDDESVNIKVSEDDDVVSDDVSNTFNSVVISPKNKKIRINNCFVSASKKNKEAFLSKWEELKNDAGSIKYSSIIGIIDDIDVMVVGDNYVIFTVKYDSLLERVNEFIESFEKMLFDYYNVMYKVVFLDTDEWNYEKGIYIDNLKNGIKYSYIEEDVEKNDDNVYTNNDVDKLISIVGNDVISYK